jgi:hypothetical protein
MDSVKFMCEDHLDKGLLGRWIINDTGLKCGDCRNMAVWICVADPPANNELTNVPTRTERQPER